MMLGWKMVMHAFRTVFGNFSDAIKASAVPFGLLIAVVFGFGSAPSLAVPTDGAGSQAQDVAGAAVLISLVVLGLYAFVFAWVAVTWHRFILLEEYPAGMPAVRNRPILPYLGKSIAAGFLLLAAAIPIMLLLVVLGLGSVAALDGRAGFSLVPFVIVTLLGTLLGWVWFRLAIVLPGTAIGQPMTFAEGWTATKPQANAIFVAVFALVVINTAINALLAPIFSSGGALFFVVQLMLQWVSLMVSVSMLTTLYGHLVEGRDLI